MYDQTQRSAAEGRNAATAVSPDLPLVEAIPLLMSFNRLSATLFSSTQVFALRLKWFKKKMKKHKFVEF